MERFKLIRAHIHIKQLAILLAVSLIALGGSIVSRTRAQSGENPWTTPINVSRSGAASQPAIAVASDERLHTVWWDALEGEQYVQTTNVTGTLWSRPVVVPQVWGSRTVVTNTQTGRVTVSLLPPLEVRMLVDVRSNVHIFWRDVDSQLWTNVRTRVGWGYAIMLADSAPVVDTVADMKGVLHLAYVRSLNSSGNPSGIYYRANASGTYWSVPVLVHASSYFRTANPEQLHVSVASDGLGRILVVWDDPESRQSLYAQSADGGRTWSDPKPTSSKQTDQVKQVRVTATSTGDFFLLWQDASAEGCGLSQRRSTDGGLTWSAPERVLTGPSRCPSHWSFSLVKEPFSFAPSSSKESGGGQLWLLGMPRADSQCASSNIGMLAVWDGRTWSGPVDVSLSFRDSTTGRDVHLSCLGMTLAGKTIGVVGSDSNGDVWAMRNKVGLDILMPTLKPAWSEWETLSEHRSQSGLPTLAIDPQGKLYTLWSQVTEGDTGAALYAATWENNRWSRAVLVLRSPAAPAGAIASGQFASRAEHPSLAVDNQGRLHAAWSSGLGPLFYSWAYSRDVALAQNWSKPVALPAPAAGDWPHIEADPRGDVLHVIYAVPYNEGRGIYYVRSDDGGAQWLTPTVVFDGVAAGWNSVDKPHLALDARAGILHAVWLHAPLPGGAGTRTVVYARSTNEGQTWSAPVKVAEGEVDEPQMAVPGMNQVYIVWNQSRRQGASATAEVWGQFSPEGGGARWTEPKRVSGFEEVSGPVSLTSDNAGGLVLVGIGRKADGGSILLHAKWDKQAWTMGETFSLGQNAVPGNTASAAIVPGARRLVVLVRGSVLEQDNIERFEVMATSREVAVAPTIQPIPTFTPLPTPSPIPTATPQLTATARPQLQVTSIPRTVQNGQSGQLPLVVGGVLVAVIIVGIVLARIVWAARQ